jgi:hypothetical protein
MLYIKKYLKRGPYEGVDKIVLVTDSVHYSGSYGVMFDKQITGGIPLTGI